MRRASRLAMESSSRITGSPGRSTISALKRRVPRSVRISKYLTGNVCPPTLKATVLVNVWNMLTSRAGPREGPACSTRRRLSGVVCSCLERQGKRRAAACFAFDLDRPVQLLDDSFRDGQSQTETTSLGRHELFKDRSKPVRGYTGTRIAHRNHNASGPSFGGQRHPSASRRGLNGIRDQIAKDPADREAIAVNRQRTVGVSGKDGDVGPLRVAAHRLDGVSDRAVDVEGEPFDGLGVRKVSQV